MSTVTSHSLHPQRGFHSTLSTAIAIDEYYDDCSFFALYSLPPSIIIDRYELIDRHVDFEFRGESNLELPVFAFEQSSSSFLLVNATPTNSRLDQVSVDIPIHARYGEPGMAQTSRQSIEISSPTCFWACPSSASVSIAFSSVSPLSNSTMLRSASYFLVSPSSSHRSVLDVPVASLRDLLPVQFGTASVVLIAFLWLMYRSCRVASALQSRHVKEQ